jgi:hypothetical protein
MGNPLGNTCIQRTSNFAIINTTKNYENKPFITVEITELRKTIQNAVRAAWQSLQVKCHHLV